MQSKSSEVRGERRIVFLIAAVQVVNVLDFMMVMPLGPYFAASLEIPISKMGWIGGAYTAAAAITGIVCSFFLDRFERRKALWISMFGLALGTLVGGFSQGMISLMLARFLAGAFGGPATSVSLSIISDRIPAKRRGTALGVVMGASSISAIFGVPVGLELARFGGTEGWRIPFMAIAVLCLLIATIATRLLPEMRDHISHESRQWIQKGFFRPQVIAAYLAYFFTWFAAFMLIPNIAVFLVSNLGWPREKLSLLYLVGGAVSFVVMRFSGRMIDRTSSFLVSLVSTGLLILVTIGGYVFYPPWYPVPVIFAGFMCAMSIRNVAIGSLNSRVPRPHERARFLSIQSAVSHISGALGAFVGASLLHQDGGKLTGIPMVATLSITVGLAVPYLVRRVERTLGDDAAPGWEGALEG